MKAIARGFSGEVLAEGEVGDNYTIWRSLQSDKFACIGQSLVHCDSIQIVECYDCLDYSDCSDDDFEAEVDDEDFEVVEMDADWETDVNEDDEEETEETEEDDTAQVEWDDDDEEWQQMTLPIVIGIGCALIGVIIILDIFLAIDAVSGNTWSEIIRHLAKSTPLIPFVCGVLSGHFFWPAALKENIPLLDQPNSIALLIWIACITGIVGLGLTKNGMMFPLWIAFLIGGVGGTLLWPVGRWQMSCLNCSWWNATDRGCCHPDFPLIISAQDNECSGFEEVHMICEACREEFIHSDEEEDLCPECMEEIEKGATKILLGNEDCALVFREDQEFPQLFLTTRKNEDEVTDLEMLLVAFAVKLHDEKFVNELILDLENILKAGGIKWQ